jgi:hypothetical protein
MPETSRAYYASDDKLGSAGNQAGIVDPGFLLFRSIMIEATTP